MSWRLLEFEIQLLLKRCDLNIETENFGSERIDRGKLKGSLDARIPGRFHVRGDGFPIAEACPEGGNSSCSTFWNQLW